MTIFNFLSKLMDTLIDRIKMIIEAKGYSPRAFAIAIGFNYSTLNNYLTGRRSTIDSELIEKALTSLTTFPQSGYYEAKVTYSFKKKKQNQEWTN